MRALAYVVIGLVGCSLTGCAGSDTSGPLTAALSTPSAATSISGISLPIGNSPSVAGSPISVYERVARGVLTCWFGGRGPLTKSHVFNAEVAPPSKGGEAEIILHEREANPLPNQLPRGARAVRIRFERESDVTTRVRIESSRLPADLLAALEKDAVAWAVEKESCDAQVVRPPAPLPEPEPVKSKKRAKVAAKRN